MTFLCATSARERDDAMIGTAPPQRRWLLLEHPGPWPVTAPFDAGIPAGLLRELGHPDTRVVLVRRPATRGARPPGAERRWFCADVDGSVRTGSYAGVAELRAAVQPGAGREHTGALLLVCTHGVHDVCCAVRGRPVAAALQRRWPEETWECSHLGGDRFAANVLVFPDAVCLGGLDESDAVGVVAGQLAGRLATDRLRGFIGMSPAVQVALDEVHRRYGPAHPRVAVGTVVERDGDQTVVRVDATGPLPATSWVTVSSQPSPAYRLTCRAVRETAALAHTVTGLTVGDR